MKSILLMAMLLISFVSKAALTEEVFYYNLKLKAETKDQRNLLAKYAHLDLVDAGYAYTVVNSFDFQKIKLFANDLIVKEEMLSITRYMDLTFGDYTFPESHNEFHTYKQILSKMKELASEYEFVHYFSMGETIQGREIPVLRITGDVNEDYPAIIFTGSHHAREHLSTEVPFNVMIQIIEAYGDDLRVTDLVNGRNIFFAPLVNPDGAMFDISVEGDFQIWRKNMRSSYGVDLNRNYGKGFGGDGSSDYPSSDVYHGEKPFSEPETAAIKRLVENTENLNIFLSFHTFSELILYPWGHKDEHVIGDDGEVFRTMALTMSEWNGYKPQKASDLYVASGDTCDWAYAEHGIFCFTFELSPKFMWGPQGFYPGNKAIAPATEANYEPMLYLIDKAADPYAVLNK